MKITIFPTHSHEGGSFAKNISDILQRDAGLISSENIEITCAPPTSKWSVLEACLSSDIVLFDATIEPDYLESNYAFAVTPLRYLYQVVIFARSKLPINFQGPHNLLEASVTSGVLSSIGANCPSESDTLLAWIVERVAAIAKRGSSRSPMPIGSLVDEPNPASLIATQCAMLHAMLLSPGSFGGLETELPRFLISYYHILVSVEPLLSLRDQGEAKELIANLYGRIFERVIMEFSIDARYPAFNDGGNQLQKLLHNAHEYARRALDSGQDIHDVLVQLLLSQPLVDALCSHRGFLGNFHLQRTFRRANDVAITSLKAQAQSSFGSNVDRLPTDLVERISRNGLTLDKLLNAAKQSKRGKTLDQMPTAGGFTQIGTETLSRQVFSELLTAASSLDTLKLDDLRARYNGGFVSHRTQYHPKLLTSANYYVVDPGTFAGPNEVFTLRTRFHIMKLLYEVIIKLDRFVVYASTDYLNSWWTCFELVAFVNAKPGNEKRVESWEGDLTFDPCLFLVSQGELFVIQRLFIYSNPLILDDDQIQHLIPIMRTIFGPYCNLAQPDKWDAIAVQCKYARGYVELKSLLNIEAPYHVFIPMSSARTDGSVSCPDHGKLPCPRRQERTACQFRFSPGDAKAKRYVWHDDEPASSCIQEIETFFIHEE